MSTIELLSNTQIKKLGERIRNNSCEKEKITKEDLIHLQNFRLSFKDSLNEIFQVLNEESKQVHKNRIVSFRMKKIDTIISKLNREKGMDLERMGDIAGCRCIVQSESAITKIVERLSKKNYELKINDKISIPDDDGYRALHIYVKSKNCKINRTVEIQLRTFEQHYWSTLVEIIDVIFDTTIKIGDNSIPDLVEFLKLYSDKDNLKIKDKVKLINIENKLNIYNQLNETFRKNIINLRMRWNTLDNFSNDMFILFEVDQDTKEAKFTVFKDYIEAEEIYFNKFNSSDEDLLVAHLNISNFKQLATAYSNYVLTNHDFQDSWIEFCTQTANLLIDKFDLDNLSTVSKSITNLFENVEDILDSDVNEIDNQFNKRKMDVDQFLKLNIWIKEREDAQDERYQKYNALQKRLELKIDEILGINKNPFMRFLNSFNPFKKKFNF